MSNLIGKSPEQLAHHFSGGFMDSSGSRVTLRFDDHNVEIQVQCRIIAAVPLLQSLLDTQLRPLAQRLDPEGLRAAEQIFTQSKEIQLPPI